LGITHPCSLLLDPAVLAPSFALMTTAIVVVAGGGQSDFE
jgi:hypothetical protein